MPNWREILDEIQSVSEGPCDVVRRKYLRRLHHYTKRNVIAYYSGWQQKGSFIDRFEGFAINDSDQNGFMAAIHKLDRRIGLDLILHTPGGSISAAEHLVTYLRSMFDIDIRAIIPHLAMSAGTMIALSCNKIVMGKHSSLGPIDPQVYGLPAHGVIEEIERAHKEIREDSSRIPIWQPIIANYNPTLIGECEKAIQWTNQIVKQWLIEGMFLHDDKGNEKAEKIVSSLSDHGETKAHDRHISIETVRSLDIKVLPLEEDNELQDLVMTVHHAYIHTLSQTATYKIIENHNGVAHISNLHRIRE